MTSRDYAAEAAKHRHVAEEYRTLSSCTSDDGLRRAYQKLAADYDMLADNEDRVASNLKGVVH
ncbi:hypothetical protein [Bradyrhizobium sp. USDA 4454]